MTNMFDCANCSVGSTIQTRQRDFFNHLIIISVQRGKRFGLSYTRALKLSECIESAYVPVADTCSKAPRMAPTYMLYNMNAIMFEKLVD